MPIPRAFFCVVIAFLAICPSAYPGGGSAQADQGDKPQPEVKLDMVSDTVAAVFDKANAILSGNLEVTMTQKADKRDDYEINAMGQRVPKKTAVKAAGSLHSDEPL